MPWKTIGKNVMVRRNGKWVRQQTAKSKKRAKATVRLMYMLKGEGKIR